MVHSTTSDRACSINLIHRSSNLIPSAVIGNRAGATGDVVKADGSYCYNGLAKSQFSGSWLP